MTAPAGLTALIAWFEGLSPATLPAIRTFYAEDAYFRDPFNELHHRDALEALFARMFRTLQNPRFTVTEQVAQADSVFLVWRFEFGVRGRLLSITGGSHLRFDESGRVSWHRDYWDAAEELYEKLPVVGFLLRQLKKLM